MGEKGGKIAVILGTAIENPRTDVQLIHQILYTATGEVLF